MCFSTWSLQLPALDTPNPLCYDFGIMAQSPATDPDAPRPLPRRSASRPAPRANRPRFQPLDAVWIAVLCLVSLAVSAWLGELAGRRLLGSLAAAGTVGPAYALGWRARARAAGVAAGLQVALRAELVFWAAYSPQSAMFGLLSVAALLAFVAGSSLAALALAAVAAMVRPDGLALGLLLLGLSFGQGRKRAGYGALVFFVPLLTFEISRRALGFGLPMLPRFGLHLGIWRWLWTPASALLLWLLVPFCGEFGEPARRARWLPTVLWSGLSLGIASLCSLTTAEAMRLPLMALLSMLAGGGLSRLLPTLAGEFPRPALRYALAALAVLGLVGLHLRLEPLVSTSAASAPRSR